MTDKQKKSNYAFNLDRLPTGPIRNEFAEYIFDYAKSHTFSTLKADCYNFHMLADFLSDCYPKMETLKSDDPAILEKKFTAWLFKTGKSITLKRYDTTVQHQKCCISPVIGYLRRVLRYLSSPETESFSYDSDVWKVDLIPLDLRASPIKNIEYLRFTDFSQEDMKKEIKQCCYHRLSTKSLSTVSRELYQIKSLTRFLERCFPNITSFRDFDRGILEEYLAYLYCEDKRKQNYRTELHGIKSILNTIGQLYDYQSLRGIFLSSDFEKSTSAVYRSYSEDEIKRLREGYKILDKQTARIMLLHELLGLRISDTLTIKKTDLYLDDTEPYIVIPQQKTNRSYKLLLSDEAKQLLLTSMDYTYKTYGDRTYLFVNNKDPDRPYQYSTLYYRLTAMISKLNLRDDHGNPFTAGTHLFRHTYGKRLCDMITDDATIAALLGHASVSTVNAYRRMSSKTLSEQTKQVIEQRNQKLEKYRKGWML